MIVLDIYEADDFGAAPTEQSGFWLNWKEMEL